MRPVVFLSVAILALALALRLGHLHERSLDNDEIAEATWSSKPFSAMMREVRRDAVHPPEDYVVQYLVGRIGSEWTRRLPSVIAGTATVGLLMLLGTWWVSRAAGLAAGLLLAMSPIHIFYSQEVRPYATALFYVCASLAALECFARRRRRVWAVVWFALVFLSGATLYFAGMIAAMAGGVRIYIDRRGALRPLWRIFPLVILGWAVMCLPWLRVVRAAARIPSPVPRETLDWSWWRWRLQALGIGSDRSWEAVSLGSWTLWALALGGLAASVRFRLLRVAAFVLIIGTASEIALLQIHPHFPAPRYLMPSWIAMFLLAGAAIGWMVEHWSTRPIAAAALIVIAGYAALQIDAFYRGDFSNWRAVAEYVHGRARPGDRIVAANNWVVRNFGYYFDRLPPIDDVSWGRYWPSDAAVEGPVWIVTGQCMPRASLGPAGLMARFPRTEQAEVLYLRPGRRLSLREELCPE